MTKEQVKIKETLSMNDRILMPQELAEGYFTADEEGHIRYTPYYADMVLINVFFMHCVDGLSFEIKALKNGTNEIAENVYEAVSADNELMALYDRFFDVNKESIQECPYKETVLQMYGILSDVEKMVEYRKLELIHAKEDPLTAFIQELTEKLKKVDMENLNLKDALEYSLKQPISTSER